MKINNYAGFSTRTCRLANHGAMHILYYAGHKHSIEMPECCGKLNNTKQTTKLKIFLCRILRYNLINKNNYFRHVISRFFYTGPIESISANQKVRSLNIFG